MQMYFHTETYNLFSVFKTHLGRDEMNNISQTTLSNVFLLWKRLNFD